MLLSLVVRSSPTTSVIGTDSIRATSVAPGGAAPDRGAPPTDTPRAWRSSVSTAAACWAGSAADANGTNDVKPSFTSRALSGPPSSDGR